MKLNTKTVSVALSTVVAASAAIPVYAAEVSYSSADSKLYVGGNSSVSNIALAIMPYEYNVDELDIDMINNHDNILFYHVEADGDYNATISLPTDIQTGKYRLSEIESGESEDAVFFIFPEDKVAEAARSMTSSSDAVRAIYALLSDAEPSLISRADSIGKYMYDTIPESGYNSESFLKNFTLYEGITSVKDSGVSFSSFMEEYASVINKSNVEEYDSLSEKQKTEAETVILHINADNKTAEEIISEVVFVSIARSADNYDDLKKTVEKYCLNTGADTGNYENLSDYDKNNVFIKLFSEKSKFTDAGYIVKRVKELSSSNSGSGGGSSSGGSGSGGGGSSSGNSGVSGGGYSIRKGNLYVTVPDNTNTDTNTGTDVKNVFNDITNHWAETEIYAMNGLGVISGTGDGTFEPDRPVTRAEFLKMLTGVLKIGTDNVSCSFSDVPADSWYYPYVAAGVNAGIAAGVSDGEFAPQSLITREDAATMVYRAKSEVLSELGSEEFADADEISSYAKDCVSALSNAKIIVGDGGYFRPKANITRAEATVLLLRTYNLK